MDQLQTAAMLMTASHRVVGRVGTVGQRLNDILNNKLNACLKVYSAEIFRHTDATTPIACFSAITMPKAMINLVLLNEETHEAPTKRLYGYVQKDTYPAFLTVPGYEIKGAIHFTTLQKPEVFLTDTILSFVPVSQATVVSTNDAQSSWTTPVVFVLRTSITLLYLDTPL